MDTNTSTESPSKKGIEAGPMRPYQPDLRCTITKMPFIYILFCSLHFDTGRAENLRFCSKVLILTVSTCFPFPVLMALLASHCFSLYWVSLIFFFQFILWCWLPILNNLKKRKYWFFFVFGWWLLLKVIGFAMEVCFYEMGIESNLWILF